ncbi:methyltransferase [Roseovarius nanhaiticus]|uniref:methyltransferase n=1 Tax=Roseovarius nanhaiticus TaxID=573024 RepID=UPI003AAAADF6
MPIAQHPVRPPQRRIVARLNHLLASPRFQALAAGLPGLRRLVRRDGEALFGLVAGFCSSQALMALVQLRIPEMLLDAPLSAQALGRRCAMPPERMDVLLRANVAGGLLKMTRKGDFALTRKGAALAGVPGLREMILHHDVLYRDLADPVAFFRGETETELAGFWPYVLGAGAGGDPELAARYSDLMTQSQRMVAADTLAAVDLTGIRLLMDIGGGSGAFLRAACDAAPDLRGLVFDLPEVVGAAGADPGPRIRAAAGSFTSDPLPEGADAISLIRVLYDHSDQTVAQLLAKVHAALPPGGRLIISEPMTGGARPSVAGDVYFALYTMAMRTGRARSADRIEALCKTAGFARTQRRVARRPFVTSVIIAEKCQSKLTDNNVRLN